MSEQEINSSMAALTLRPIYRGSKEGNKSGSLGDREKKIGLHMEDECIGLYTKLGGFSVYLLNLVIYFAFWSQAPTPEGKTLLTATSFVVMRHSIHLQHITKEGNVHHPHLTAGKTEAQPG